MNRHILAHVDWGRVMAHGAELAVEQARAGAELKATDAMWSLLKEAASVSARADGAPPRTGLPSKSAMPDASDDVTAWQMMSAYIRGEVEEKPEMKARPPIPSASEIDRAWHVLDLWHASALRDIGDWKRMRKAVYMKACGVPDRKVRAVTGFSRQRIHSAKVRAMQDMLDFIRGC